MDVQLLLGHSSPDMVRRYTSTYNAEQGGAEVSRVLALDAAAR